MAASFADSARASWRLRFAGIIGYGATLPSRRSKSVHPTKRKTNGSVKQRSILGSPGSIGRQCLSVVEALPERFGVVALAAGADLGEVSGEITRHRAKMGLVGGAARAD